MVFFHRVAFLRQCLKMIRTVNKDSYSSSQTVFPGAQLCHDRLGDLSKLKYLCYFFLVQFILEIILFIRKTFERTRISRGKYPDKYVDSEVCKVRDGDDLFIRRRNEKGGMEWGWRKSSYSATATWVAVPPSPKTRHVFPLEIRAHVEWLPWGGRGAPVLCSSWPGRQKGVLTMRVLWHRNS